jgi:hypothetical protein
MCADSEGSLSTIPSPQILETQQLGQEGPCLTADVDEIDLTGGRLFNGSSLGRCADGVTALIY